MLHINSPTKENIPAYGRISGFLDYCRENQIPHEMFIEDLGINDEDLHQKFTCILDQIQMKYPDKKKGIFISNDTYASVFLNLLIRRYGKLPDDFYLVGFDNSPISRQAVIPISTVGQQINKIAQESMKLLVGLMDSQKKRNPAPLSEPVHKTIPPLLILRDTTEKNIF